MKVFSYESIEYEDRRKSMTADQWNGAFYYSQEIVKNIIPNVKTDRNWVTINVVGQCYDHSIVFIHNNKDPSLYEWLKGYKDLVLVVGVPETIEKVKHLADHVIYLPLSVDVAEVEKYRRPKTKCVAYVGRRQKMYGLTLPFNCEVLGDMPREELLPAMAEYEKVYTVGRCAIEARILGCEIGVYDPRYPDTSIWKVVDNKKAAKILQAELDKIDSMI